MIWKKALLEINDKNIVYKEMIKSNSLMKLFNKNGKNYKHIKIEDFEKIKVDLKNKNLFVLVHGEEIYVKIMTLPKLKNRKLYNLIREELKNRFKNIDNIMFSYEILKDNGYNLEVIVFCMNWDKVNMLKSYNDSSINIEGIVPIQFYILEKYKNKIKEENYVVILILEEIVYFIACHKQKVIFNNVFKNSNRESFFDYFDQFKLKLGILVPNISFQTIMFINFPYKDLIENISHEYKCEDLGNISTD